MTGDEPVRDAEVARALEGIAVPDYEPGFWDRLDARLVADAVPAAGVPVGQSAGDPATLELAPVAPLARPVRLAERRRSLVVLGAAAAVLLAVLAVRLTADDPEDVRVASEVEGGTQPGPDDGTTTPDARADDRDPEGDLPDDDGAARPFVAGEDAASDEPSALTAPASTTVAEFGGSTGPAPTSVRATPTTPQGAFLAWAKAVDEGDTETALALTGPRTLAYYEALGVAPDDVVSGAEEQWSGWATAKGRRIDLIELGSVDRDRVVGLVVERAGTTTHDAVPVVQGEDGWQVEPAAFDPDTGGRIEIISPNPGPAGLEDLPRDGIVRVAAAPDGEYYLGLDLEVSTRIPASDAVDGEIRWDPGPQKQAGTSHLLIVAHVSKGSISIIAVPFGTAP